MNTRIFTYFNIRYPNHYSVCRGACCITIIFSMYDNVQIISCYELSPFNDGNPTTCTNLSFDFDFYLGTIPHFCLFFYFIQEYSCQLT